MTQITKVCRGCKTAFVFDKKEGKCGRIPAYCSKSCYPSSAPKRTARECSECKVMFTPAGRRGPAAGYCSRRCSNSAYYSIARVPEEWAECTQCGDAFSRSERGWQAMYCTEECKLARYRKGYPITNCETCGVELTTRGAARRFCDDHRPPDSLASKIRREKIRAGENIAHEEIFERDEWICGICEEPVDPDLSWPHKRSATLDHIIPLGKDGAHTHDNVQCAHRECNEWKAARIAA